MQFTIASFLFLFRDLIVFFHKLDLLPQCSANGFRIQKQRENECAATPQPQTMDIWAYKVMFLVHLIDWYHFLVFALPSIFVTSFRFCFSYTIDKVTHRRMHCTRVPYLQLIDDVNRKIVMFNRTLKIAHRRHIQMIKLSMVRNICVSFHQANSIIGNCARLIA